LTGEVAGDSFAFGRNFRLGVAGVISSTAAAAAAAAAAGALPFGAGGRLKAGRLSAAAADSRRALGMQLTFPQTAQHQSIVWYLIFP
jgi:hypothetical protein